MTTGLLRLPAELRNRIYLHLLYNRTLVTISSGCHAFDKSDLSLLHLCRALRQEVIPIIFGTPRFTFDLTLHVNYIRAGSFLLNLPNEAISSLRRLSFQAEAICNCIDSTGSISCEVLNVYIDANEGRSSRATYDSVNRHGNQRIPCKAKKKGLQRRPPRRVEAVLRKIDNARETQSVRKEDLEELLDALKPISSFMLS